MDASLRVGRGSHAHTRAHMQSPSSRGRICRLRLRFPLTSAHRDRRPSSCQRTQQGAASPFRHVVCMPVCGVAPQDCLVSDIDCIPACRVRTTAACGSSQPASLVLRALLPAKCVCTYRIIIVISSTHASCNLDDSPCFGASMSGRAVLGSCGTLSTAVGVGVPGDGNPINYVIVFVSRRNGGHVLPRHMASRFSHGSEPKPSKHSHPKIRTLRICSPKAFKLSACHRPPARS